MCFSYSEILLITIVTNCVIYSFFVDPNYNSHSTINIKYKSMIIDTKQLLQK